MKRFIVLSVLIIVTGLILWFLSYLDHSGTSDTLVWGLPVTSSIDSAEPAWLKIGGGYGVLVIGFFGFGIVCFTLYGAGLLLGTGQLSGGLISIGQAGVGVVAFLGQAGTGFVGAGQVVVGGLGWAQGRLALNGEAFIKALSKDLNDLLSFK